MSTTGHAPGCPGGGTTYGLPCTCGADLSSGELARLRAEHEALKRERDAPAPGTVVKCLVCALEKPWAIWSPRGEAVCFDCREARIKLASAEADIAEILKQRGVMEDALRDTEREAERGQVAALRAALETYRADPEEIAARALEDTGDET